MPCVLSSLRTVSDGCAPRVEPVADALLVQDDRRRVGLRVVAADRLDDAAVAGRAAVGDDDAPDRVLLPPTRVSLMLTDICGAVRQSSGSRISSPRSGILPCCRPFIILRISPNCLTSWLTCWTVVPEPLAIRSRREPLISSGWRRSYGRHRQDDRLDRGRTPSRRPASSRAGGRRARGSSRAATSAGPSCGSA